MTIIITIITGIAAGMVSGMLGVGGGTITIPVMVLALQLEQHTAQGIALFAMLFTALFGSYIHGRQGNVQLKTALLIAPAAVAFSILGAFTADVISADWLTRIFAIFLLLIGCRMVIFGKGGNDVKAV